MSRETTMRSDSGTEHKSFGELFSALVGHSAALLRDEIALAKQEMHEKVKILQSGLIAIVTGTIIVQVAFIALCTAAVIRLAAFIGFEMSALIIGTGLALIGGVVALSGLRELRQMNFKPEKTLQTLKENKEWLK